MWEKGVFYFDQKAFPWINNTFTSVGIFFVTSLQEHMMHFSVERRIRDNEETFRHVKFYPPTCNAKLLLVQQGDLEEKSWNIVAGKREGIESAKETAIREGREETGLKYNASDYYFLAAFQRHVYFSAQLPDEFDPTSLLPTTEISSYQLVDIERYYAALNPYSYSFPHYRADIKYEQKCLLKQMFNVFDPGFV